MKFKDVMHLYVGCTVQLIKDEWGYKRPSNINWLLEYIPYLKHREPIPYLYPLSAMTEEQAKNVGFDPTIVDLQIYLSEYMLNNPIITATEFKYLLDNHFDIYDLISQGEAIDVTTLETNPYQQEEKK